MDTASGFSSYGKTGAYVIQETDGTTMWYLNDELHREDGPAFIEHDNTQHWYLNGLRHRTDGPAIIYPDGRTSWYVNGGFRITDSKTFQFKAGVSDEDMVALILKYGEFA